MRSYTARVGVLGMALALSACGGQQDIVEQTHRDTPSATASASPIASPALDDHEQVAVDEATAAVLAYRQTLTDLYSGARTNLNDLNLVTVGVALEQGLPNASIAIRKGYRVEPQGVHVTVASAEPKKLTLKKGASTVVLSVCIDATQLEGVDPDGSRHPGVRERLDYKVVQTKHLPAPGWAVTQVTSDEKAGQREC